METELNALLSGELESWLAQPAHSTVPEGTTLGPAFAGMPLFDAPLLGVADAADPIFADFQKPGVVGLHHLLPAGLLPGAQRVVSVFFPYTAEICRANARDYRWPATEWLHARIDGQAHILAAVGRLVEWLQAAGHQAVMPAAHPLYKAENNSFTSNWSERHAAYACGLGTFSLNRGLITQKGMAGRFGSLVTTARLAPTPRPYSRHDEYCSRCGACAAHCPVGAISLRAGKAHPPCSAFLDETAQKTPPYYGCGKCQVAVPCSRGIPAAAPKEGGTP